MNIRSHSQLADLLTKALNLSQFTVLIGKMGILNIHSSGVHLEGECQRLKQQQQQQLESEQKSDLEQEGNDL